MNIVVDDLSEIRRAPDFFCHSNESASYTTKKHQHFLGVHDTNLFGK